MVFSSKSVAVCVMVTNSNLFIKYHYSVCCSEIKKDWSP